MGVSVLADEIEVERNHVQGLYGKFMWQAGLIIGRVTPKKTYVVTLVPTPEEPSPEAGDDAEPSFEPSSRSFDSLERGWIGLQASQVRGALPGGVDIIGIYLFGPGKDDYSTKLRQLVYTVCGDISIRNSIDVFCEAQCESKDRLAVHFCSQSKKITCRSYNVNDNKAPARPADWRYGHVLKGWRQIRCTFPVHVDAAVKNMKDAASSVVSAIKDSKFVFPPSNSVSKPNALISDNESTHVTVLTKRPVLGKNSHIAAGMVKINGLIQGLSYLPPKTTASDATLALQCDLERSTLERFRVMHADIEANMSEGEGQQLSIFSKATVTTLPLRYTATLCGDLPVSFYEVADDEDDETYSDVRTYFKHFFGIAVEAMTVTSHERHQKNKNLSFSAATGPDTGTSTAASQQSQSQFLLLPIVVGVVALIFGFLLLKSE